MTNKEELDWLCRLRSEIYVYMPKEWLIPMNNALDMAIKALEQETAPFDLELYQAGLMYMSKEMIEVLDKIRAEIEQMPSELTADGRRMIRRGSVFRIIDKYRKEQK